MENNALISYAPINFYRHRLGVFIKILAVFVAAWLVFYATANHATREYIHNHPLITVLIFFIITTIALLQMWVGEKVYIYNIAKNENIITFKWQEFRTFNEISLPIEDVIVKLQPSGKNTPYLEIKLKQHAKTQILKQIYYPGWNKETMANFVRNINECKAIR